MPQYTYPGVYIEEIPSGVRTITGVATSITAFVGWARQGPADQAVLITSWADYDRLFGGLDRASDMSYAVSHFFTNGGQTAYIVRVTGAGAALASATLGDLTLTATGPGEWAHDYGASIKLRTNDPDQHFTLTIARQGPNDAQPQVLEVFENLSLRDDDQRYVKLVIDEQSQYMNATVNGDSIAGADLTMLDGGANGDELARDSAEFWSAVLPADADENGRRGGVYFLERIDLFNLLCVPGATNAGNLSTLAQFCRTHRAFLIADAENFPNEQNANPLAGDDGINAAIYYPWLRLPDPHQQNRLRAFPPSGAVAGIYARTDATRGVWKAPAGIDASVSGARGVTNMLTDTENGPLNQRAVNCVRTFPVYGTVVWGARTCRGIDEIGSEWKYVPVRRTALFIEETLYRSLKWVVFEPNDEPLWAQIRLNVGAFMHGLFRQGAFQGRSPREAYFIKCDKETTTQNDINLGIVNILVGFAPLKPAEFVVVKLQQMAGQIEV
ncbi:MAG TPA: phage tail sheath subtilisin-like domain-containing protein [Kouleothrix sp.]|mgnify:CR=1 FL=1|uniref:phage tail sheath C-terminal domain-containing protein n=1 Tax=Kouleothrix sp. TaxID=2779161 RepID=UPI002B7AAAFA|nr:phage tail sheath subtilisin-like domain-containing protein [Kouleothrix sp.]HRC74304.1 phage tail sheath subtilisin-like domain-containing protein [Kouleothrix sp.]